MFLVSKEARVAPFDFLRSDSGKFASSIRDVRVDGKLAFNQECVTQWMSAGFSIELELLGIACLCIVAAAAFERRKTIADR